MSDPNQQYPISNEVLVAPEKEIEDRLHILERLVIGGIGPDGKFAPGLLQHVTDLKDEVHSAGTILKFGIGVLAVEVLTHIDGLAPFIKPLINLLKFN